MHHGDGLLYTRADWAARYAATNRPRYVAPASERAFIFDYAEVAGMPAAGSCFVHINRFYGDGSAVVLLIDMEDAGACVSKVAGELCMALYQYCLPDMVPQYTPQLITFLERDRLGDWAYIELEWRRFREEGLCTRVVRWHPLPSLHPAGPINEAHYDWCAAMLPGAAFEVNAEA